MCKHLSKTAEVGVGSTSPSLFYKPWLQGRMAAQILKIFWLHFCTVGVKDKALSVFIYSMSVGTTCTTFWLCVLQKPHEHQCHQFHRLSDGRSTINSCLMRSGLSAIQNAVMISPMLSCFGLQATDHHIKITQKFNIFEALK